MERITSIQKIEHADGSSHEQIYCFGHLWGPAFFKSGTKDYEEYLSIVKRLAEYEDLEEQGKLLKLPCAVGDTVYTIYSMSADKHFIYDFKLDERSLVLNTIYGNFGKNVFLAREAAEAVLKELSGAAE